MTRRADILALLRTSDEGLELADIAARLDVHVNTVRFHLARLVADGLVERASGQLGRRGRPPLVFRAVRSMDPTGPRNYRLLAQILLDSLADQPDPGPVALEAGRRWGSRQSVAPRHTGAVEALMSLLREMEFSPERHGHAIGLRHCPFLELVDQPDEVVCSVHLGLMRGALEAQDAAVTVARLDPFAEPDLCLAHLAEVS